MPRLFPRLLAALLAAILFCPLAETSQARAEALLADHPLVGKVWSVTEGRFIARDALTRAATEADLLIIGEKHDNAAHHAIQADLVADAVAAGRRPALAFEMMTRDRQAAIDDVLAGARDENPAARLDTVLAALAEAAGWKDSGWPDWSLYRPIAASVVKAGGPVIAADLAPSMKRTAAKDGVAALPRRWRDRLALDAPLSAATRAALAEEIKAAHCGYATADMIEAMIRVQRARDAALAMAMLDARDAPDAGQAILITGNGHARDDRAVPWLVRRALGDAPGARVLSVGLIEARPGLVTPEDYADGADTPLPYDIVVFTSPTALGDPCERFREQLEKMKRHQPPKDG